MSRDAMPGLFPVSVCLLALGATAFAQGKVDFEREVYPFLERSCVSCHRAPYEDSRGRRRRPKAGLALDGAKGILAGSNRNDVVVAGKPKESLLYTVVTLPEEHEDFMPLKGQSLSPDEVATLRRWIAEGADFGGWGGVGGPVTKKQVTAAAKAAGPRASVALFDGLGSKLSPLAAGVVKKALGPHGVAEPVQPGSPLLRVSFVSYESEVDDARVKAMRSIASHVVVLDLSGTRVTDAAADTLARMKRLVRLRLDHTEIADRGVTKLATLPELRSLNLHGTDVSDAGIASLAEASKLTDLYVHQTRVTADGVAALSDERQNLRVRHRLTLPKPPAERTNRRGRRRKKKN